MFGSLLDHQPQSHVDFCLDWLAIKSLLQECGFGGFLSQIPYSFSRQDRRSIVAWIDLEGLRQRHIRVHGKEHLCPVCDKIRSLGFDGQIGFTTNVGNHRAGGFVEYPFVQTRIGYGCLCSPVTKRLFCAAHVPVKRDFRSSVS